MPRYKFLPGPADIETAREREKDLAWRKTRRGPTRKGEEPSIKEPPRPRAKFVRDADYSPHTTPLHADAAPIPDEPVDRCTECGDEIEYEFRDRLRPRARKSKIEIAAKRCVNRNGPVVDVTSACIHGRLCKNCWRAQDLLASTTAGQAKFPPVFDGSADLGLTRRQQDRLAAMEAEDARRFGAAAKEDDDR